MTEQTTEPAAPAEAGAPAPTPAAPSQPTPVAAAKVPLFQQGRAAASRAMSNLIPGHESDSDPLTDRRDEQLLTDGPSSSPGSIDDVDERERRPRTKAQLRKALAKGTKSAGGIAHKLLTRHDEDQQAAGVWLVDDETADDIAEPASSLLARRGLKFTADAGDVIDLVTAVGSWAADQLAKRRDIRAARQARVVVDDQAAA